MPDLHEHLRLAEAELEALEAGPLSVRHALLVAALIDRTAEVAFPSRTGHSGLPPAGDVLAFRVALRRACPALGAIADLCGMAEGTPRLRIESVAVAPGETDTLTAAEFMVSLYNGFAVPRVVIAGPESAEPVLPLLRAALAWWHGRVA